MIVQLHDAFIGLRLLKVDCIWHSANVKPMDILEVFVHPQILVQSGMSTISSSSALAYPLLFQGWLVKPEFSVSPTT